MCRAPPDFDGFSNANAAWSAGQFLPADVVWVPRLHDDEVSVLSGLAVALLISDTEISILLRQVLPRCCSRQWQNLFGRKSQPAAGIYCRTEGLYRRMPSPGKLDSNSARPQNTPV